MTFGCSVRSLLRHLQLILKMLDIWHIKSLLRCLQLILRILDPAHLGYEEPAQTTYSEDFPHLAIQKPLHLKQPEPPVF